MGLQRIIKISVDSCVASKPTEKYQQPLTPQEGVWPYKPLPYSRGHVDRVNLV